MFYLICKVNLFVQFLGCLDCYILVFMVILWQKTLILLFYGCVLCRNINTIHKLSTKNTQTFQLWVFLLLMILDIKNAT